MQGKLFIIAGCSGVGKGTLLKAFLERNPAVKLSISTTTRTPRPEEKEGVNYFFVTKEEFLKSVENNEFLEWAEFGGNFYGTNKNFVEKTLNKGIDIILEIEVQGAKQVKTKMPQAKTIFIMPPSKEVLEQRLRGRKTEDEASVLLRLKAAEREIPEGKSFDYNLVNDDLETAICDLQKIFDSERNK